MKRTSSSFKVAISRILDDSTLTRGNHQGWFDFDGKVSEQWAKWIHESGSVICVFEFRKDGPESREKQLYHPKCFRSAMANAGVEIACPESEPFRIWFRRKFKGRWEPYWYAPR